MKARINFKFSNSPEFEKLIQKVIEHRLDNYTAADEILLKMTQS